MGTEEGRGYVGRITYYYVLVPFFVSGLFLSKRALCISGERKTPTGGRDTRQSNFLS
jgi:hypothetical protein